MVTPDYFELVKEIRKEAKQLGFAELRITDLDMSEAAPHLAQWLQKGHHGDMNYMSDQAYLRTHPQELLPGVIRAICVRLDYVPEKLLEKGNTWRENELHRLENPSEAVVSIYARGRDYHKVIRQRLQALATKIQEKISVFSYRVFVDSAPLMEVEFAQKSGIGWRGKHTLALNREGGSMFFLGEILIDCPLPLDEPISSHCGDCQACIDICPTQAIIGPYQIDARRCISYLTIEHKGVIPVEFRSLMGNRIYGCDDCQLVCPWNKFAQKSLVEDFQERNQLGQSELLELFSWTEEDFNKKLEGSPIRRIGYERWSRNLSVSLGNTLRDKNLSFEVKDQIISALNIKFESSTAMVREHILWALEQDKFDTLE